MHCGLRDCVLICRRAQLATVFRTLGFDWTLPSSVRAMLAAAAVWLFGTLIVLMIVSLSLCVTVGCCERLHCRSTVQLAEPVEQQRSSEWTRDALSGGDALRWADAVHAIVAAHLQATLAAALYDKASTLSTPHAADLKTLLQVRCHSHALVHW